MAAGAAGAGITAGAAAATGAPFAGFAGASAWAITASLSPRAKAHPMHQLFAESRIARPVMAKTYNYFLHKSCQSETALQSFLWPPQCAKMGPCAGTARR